MIQRKKGLVIDKSSMFKQMTADNRAMRIANLLDSASDAVERCRKHPADTVCDYCDPD